MLLLKVLRIHLMGIAVVTEMIVATIVMMMKMTMKRTMTKRSPTLIKKIGLYSGL